MRQRRPSEVSNWQRLGLGSGACASASWLLFVVDTFFGIFMRDPQFEVTKQSGSDVTKEGRDCAARRAAGRRNLVENELELSNKMIARGLRAVKVNLLVIRMDVAGLTQWGTSWRRERVCGRGGIRKNCGNLWKKSKTLLRAARRMGRPRCEMRKWWCRMPICW